MAQTKSVLQMLSFAFGESEVSFASQCVFTTLPLGEEAVQSMGGFTDYLVEQIGWKKVPLVEKSLCGMKQHVYCYLQN